MYSNIVGFDEIVRFVRESVKGTMIIIVGPVGCGKSTLAIKLIKELNGNDNLFFINTHTDVDFLKNDTVNRDRACLIDDQLHASSLLCKACELTEHGYIPVVTPSSSRYIPRQYREADESRDLLSITFTTRGLFSAIHHTITPTGPIYRLSKGTVTQKDVDEVRSITNTLLERRAGFR